MGRPAWRIFSIACTIAAVSLAALVGCETEEADGLDGEGAAAEVGDDASHDYRVILANAIADTLRGRAGFGTIMEPETGEDRFVIRLASGFDFAGGIVIARRDSTLPEPGDYDLSVTGDSLAQADEDQFLVLYREGMLRDLRAQSGTLTLSTVTDTLIVGRLDAMLEGTVAGFDRQEATVEVHAVGRFRAHRNLGGYVIGL